MTFFDTFFQKVKIFKKTHQIDENTKAHTLFNFCDSSLFDVFIFFYQSSHTFCMLMVAKKHTEFSGLSSSVVPRKIFKKRKFC